MRSGVKLVFPYAQLEGEGRTTRVDTKTELNYEPTKINNEGSSIYFFKNDITLSEFCSWEKKTFKVETVGVNIFTQSVLIRVCRLMLEK